MTNYPNGQDNNITLPGVSGSSEEDIAINALRDATFAIEKELGITPSGVYTDVRARFDILEARINNPVSQTILSDGYVNSPLYIVNTPASVTLSISTGSGVPTENRIDGSLFLRTDGSVDEGLYSRRNGAWVKVPTDAFVASGDLTGTYLSQTVIGLYGKKLRPNIASVGAVQDGYHLTWNNTDGYWEAQTGFIPGGDLQANSLFHGRISQTVRAIQGRTISNAAPNGTNASNGDVLAWNTVDSQWQPQARAIIFDGYVAKTNIRSDKLLQSPIVNSKVGIVNFGSRSSGVTLGATENYAAILSGDRGTATGAFSLIVGGDSHTVSGQYSSILNGLTNTASGQYSTVLNGTTNQATQTYSFVLDGYGNVASGVASFVLSGANNAPSAIYSSVLNGIGNTIGTTSNHAAIGFGTSNTIGLLSSYALILGGSGNNATGTNILVGTSSGTNAQSNYVTVLNGQTHTVNAASNYGFVGSGTGHNVTGAHATVLNGISGTVNGLHATVLNGNTNSVTATHSTIVNGNNNTISGGTSYAAIFDGYQNTVSGLGSIILDGYQNTISGIFSSILNGNNNNIASRNSTVLNGSLNTVDSTSVETTILDGTGNSVTNSISSLLAGNGNTLATSNNTYIFGSFNNVQSNSSKVIGSMNVIGTGGSFNRIFGNNNVVGNNITQNTIFGPSNQLVNATHDNIIAGASNIVDAGGNSVVIGANNIANSNFGSVFGQYGKARMFGQQVHANSRFTVGRIGEAQFSRVVLTGAAASGAGISLQLQDGSPANVSFVDGYSYDMQIRVLVVNTSPISPNPVVPARFVFDVLAHQEGGNIVLDNVNQTVITTNTSDDPTGSTRTIGWSVTISSTGNQLTVTVDPETSSANYVQPQNTPSARRAVATIEMREITRL